MIAVVQVSQRKRSSASIPGERITIKRKFGVSPCDPPDDDEDDEWVNDNTYDSNDDDDVDIMMIIA